MRKKESVLRHSPVATEAVATEAVSGSHQSVTRSVISHVLPWWLHFPIDMAVDDHDTCTKSLPRKSKENKAVQLENQKTDPTNRPVLDLAWLRRQDQPRPYKRNRRLPITSPLPLAIDPTNLLRAPLTVVSASFSYYVPTICLSVLPSRTS